jgi:hypothetical protein
MANPFVSPQSITPRPRIFLWGPPGAGKTRCALSLGKVALIDLERGSQYYKDEFNFDLIQPKTWGDIVDAVKWLAGNQHDYNTVVIDPVTLAWEMLQEVFLAEKRRRKNDQYAEITGGDWRIIKPRYKALMNLLTKIDMNVVLIARGSKNYVDGEGEMLRVDKADPEKADAEKNTAYIMDTEIQLRAERQGNGKAKFIGTARKDRTYKFPTQPFEFTLAAIKQFFGAIVDQASQPMTAAQVAQASATEAPQGVVCECGAQIDPKTITACMQHFGRPLCVECGKQELAKKNGNERHEPSDKADASTVAMPAKDQPAQDDTKGKRTAAQIRVLNLYKQKDYTDDERHEHTKTYFPQSQGSVKNLSDKDCLFIIEKLDSEHVADQGTL